MSLERLIENARTMNGTHGSSLKQAQERMVETNKRLSKEFKDSIVTEELLNKVINL